MPPKDHELAPSNDKHRAVFSGVQIDCLTLEASVLKCRDLINERGHQHVVVNAAKIILANDSPHLKEIINGCSLVNIDGQSVVWALRLLGYTVPHRVTGIDLMLTLIEESPKQNWRVGLLGATEEVVSTVSTVFKSSGVNVVYARNGYWRPDEETQIVRSIAETAPDLLLIAFPSPKKETFLAEHLDDLNTGLAFGVGGSFDIVAGQTKRAPIVFQKLGLEWLFRLFQEPRRMFKRYLVGNFRFISLLIRTLFQKTIRKNS